MKKWTNLIISPTSAGVSVLEDNDLHVVAPRRKRAIEAAFGNPHEPGGLWGHAMPIEWKGLIVVATNGARSTVSVLTQPRLTPDSRFVIYRASGPRAPTGFQEMELDHPAEWLAELTALDFRLAPAQIVPTVAAPEKKADSSRKRALKEPTAGHGKACHGTAVSSKAAMNVGH
jgi:hypothetical protein